MQLICYCQFQDPNFPCFLRIRYLYLYHEISLHSDGHYQFYLCFLLNYPPYWCLSKLRHMYLSPNNKHHHLRPKFEVFHSIPVPPDFEECDLADITPYIPAEVNRRCGGTYCVQIHDRRITKAWLRYWKWRKWVPQKRLWTCTRMHDVSSQKIFIVTAVKTSNVLGSS
jgi:hypothetical protein